jgi:hypothetical protein
MDLTEGSETSAKLNDAGEIPKRKHTSFRTRRKSEIKNSILLYFSFYDGSHMLWQNNAILSEQLFSFLSHFNVNMVEDKSEYNKIIP